MLFSNNIFKEILYPPHMSVFSFLDFFKKSYFFPRKQGKNEER